jgi:hypothetical protein
VIATAIPSNPAMRKSTAPDVSLNGAADLLGVVAALLLGWLVLFDFPSGSSPGVGVYLALIAGIVMACGAGDFRVTSLFPRMPDGDG